MSKNYLSQIERITRLGRLGEELAAECLQHNGFTGVENLNERRRNYPFADIAATRENNRYFIGVKARNEFRADGKLNESYNLVLISDAMNRELKKQGMTPDQITQLLLKEVRTLASQEHSIPAWLTIALRSDRATYSAYFGLLKSIGNRRSIPMLPRDRQSYEVLAEHSHDSRITLNLLNR